MILDKIENLHLYKSVNRSINTIIEFISTNNILEMKPGRYELDDKGNYFLINEYTTSNNYGDILEAHKKYLDLQFIVRGQEVINYESKNSQLVDKEYDEVADYLFYKKMATTQLHFNTGQFTIFFPDDLHMPAQILNNSSEVKKIVFKVLID